MTRLLLETAASEMSPPAPPSGESLAGSAPEGPSGSVSSPTSMVTSAELAAGSELTIHSPISPGPRDRHTS